MREGFPLQSNTGESRDQDRVKCTCDVVLYYEWLSQRSTMIPNGPRWECLHFVLFSRSFLILDDVEIIDGRYSWHSTKEIMTRKCELELIFVLSLMLLRLPIPCRANITNNTATKNKIRGNKSVRCEFSSICLPLHSTVPSLTAVFCSIFPSVIADTLRPLVFGRSFQRDIL